MTNHVHLLLTPATTDGASLLMKYVAQRYAQYVNRSYERSGALWEGRFKSSLVQRQRYFLNCQRYIELNPVRAGIVPNPVDYPWSSFRPNAGLAESTLIAPHEVFLALGNSGAERGAAYLDFFNSEMREEDLHQIRNAASGGFALGDEQFQHEMSEMLGTRVRRLRNRLRQRASGSQ